MPKHRVRCWSRLVVRRAAARLGELQELIGIQMPRKRYLYLATATRGSPTFCGPPIREYANPFETRRELRRQLTPFRIWKCPRSRALKWTYK